MNNNYEDATPIFGEAENDDEVLRGIIEVFGANNQIIKAVEELGELSQALCKYITSGSNEAIIDHIAEEWTDVSIMIEQLRIIFDEKEVFHEQAPAYRKAKIQRIKNLSGRY